MKETNWTLFNSQEEVIKTINLDLFNLRKQKYPEYGDSYYKYYIEFGMNGMVGDLYRKFDRLKNMAKVYSEQDVIDKEKEIKDQFYDIISYCQLQLYFLENEKWGPNRKIHSHKITSSSGNDYGDYVRGFPNYYPNSYILLW